MLFSQSRNGHVAAARAIVDNEHHSSVAQLVEQAAVNRLVGGSSPSRGANKIKGLGDYRLTLFYLNFLVNFSPRIPFLLATLIFSTEGTLATRSFPKKYYQDKWCVEHNGQAKIVLADQTRADNSGFTCLNKLFSFLSEISACSYAACWTAGSIAVYASLGVFLFILECGRQRLYQSK